MGGIWGLRMGGWMKRIGENTLNMCSSTRLIELCGTRMDDGIEIAEVRFKPGLYVNK